MNRRRLMLIAILSVLVFPITVGLGQADEFYKGRSIRMIVSYFPGGAFDIYSRVIARHLPKHIPGSPSIIVQNMPGAGTVIGANYLYRLARRDGTALGVFGPTQVVRQVIGVPGVEFESDKFNWLVAANTGDVLTCIANAAAEVRTLDDAVKRKTPLIVAATGPGSFTTSSAKAYKDILRANFKIVTGYPGQAGILNALQRGEADAGCFTWSAVKAAAKDMLDTKAAVVFTQTGMKGAPDLPHLENGLDRAKTKVDRQVLMALLTEVSMGRAYAAPPDVPRDRVALLRKAFMDTLRDPRFLDEANRIGLEVNPLPGEGVQNIVTDLKKLPREAMDKIRSIMEEP